MTLTQDACALVHQLQHVLLLYCHLLLCYDLDDIDPRLLCSKASHLGKLVECLDADSPILVCAVLHKGSDSLPAHLCHPLVELNVL